MSKFCESCGQKLSDDDKFCFATASFFFTSECIVILAKS